MLKRFLRGFGKRSPDTIDSKKKAAPAAKARRGGKAAPADPSLKKTGKPKADGSRVAQATTSGRRRGTGRGQPKKGPHASSASRRSSTPARPSSSSSKGSSPGGRDRGRGGPRQPERSGQAGDRGLTDAILRVLEKDPLQAQAIRQSLRVHRDDLALFDKALASLEREGRIVRVSGDRFILPETADLFTGKLQLHAGGSGHVLAEEEGGKDLFIASANLDTALHGDRVVARLIQQPRDHGRPRRDGRTEGRILRVLERAGAPIVGTLQKTKNFHHVVADDPRFPRNLYVPSAEGAKIGDKVVAQMDRWENSQVNPEGRIVEVLGAADAPGVDMLSVIHKHRLPRDFPAPVSIEAEKFGGEVTDSDHAGREDLRGRNIITIDPDDARDFDDAIEVQPTDYGWDVAVHIADVSHYVKPGTTLDKEARTRGNSVYLADRVIPMLPENLSNGLCSLRPDEDRLAFSVFAQINHDGTIRHVRFGRSVIRSSARLTYRQAFALLQTPPQDEVGRRVHAAWDCSSTLRKKRFAAGALDLEMPEVKVWLDKEGRPTKLELVENDISHQLIEELMLLANELVARHLKRRKQPNIYRIHEKPEPEKLDEYRDLAATYGVKAGDLSHRPELQKLLDGLKGKPYASALKIGLLKSLKRARYSPDPLGHFGLSKSDYSHFTSPIRRYADLLTHRSLARDLDPKQHGPTSADLGPVSEHLSTTERTAADAEKESVRLKKLEYFSKLAEADTKGGVAPSFDARVIEARNYGLLVELPDAMMTGLVPVSILNDDFYHFDAPRSRLIGKHSKRVLKAGDLLRVQVARVDPFKQQIDFKLASEGAVQQPKSRRR
ncbi:MAG: ribonuclease R [Chthoniobacterales bacterium]